MSNAVPPLKHLPRYWNERCAGRARRRLGYLPRVPGGSILPSAKRKQINLLAYFVGGRWKIWAVGGDLFFELRMRESMPGLNDPDLRSPPPVEGGSAEECKADHPPEADWTPWMIYVFTKKEPAAASR